MKSILLHVTDDPGLDARMQVAFDLGRVFDAHITFLQTIPVAYTVPADIYGMSAAQITPTLRETAAEHREALKNRLEAEGVSWDWVTVDGPADARILSIVNTYDLLVLSAADPFGRRSSLAEDMAVNAHTAVLVVPERQTGFDCSKPVIVAWNGSAEASRALRAAVPLLHRAETVYLLGIEDDRGERAYDLPASSGSEYLSRHGIESELVELRRNGLSTAECIRSAASDRGAGFIVMGAYGRSRLRESLLGGVTRDMMSDSELPLLMHH